MIFIKRDTQKYKSWITHRNKKNLIRRTQKKLAVKAFRTRENEYNRSLKKYIPYDKEERSYKFTAPLIFSFSENSEETTRFFNDIIDFISNPKNFGKKIFVDISNIEMLTTDALMYLLAIVNNLNDRFRNKYRFSGNSPSKPEIKKLFMESGFYDFVRYQGKDPLTKNTDSIKIVSGTNSNTKIAKQIADFVISKTGLTKIECQFIYVMMIELMSNTHKHAYNENEFLLPQWYCFAEFDKVDTIKFTFMDTGAGIPSTVKKNFAEKIDILRIKGDDKYVVSALNGDFRTSTEKTYRGKGLPKIRQICAEQKIYNTRILTNKADVKIYPSSYEYKINKNPLQGTLFYWQINISKLKGEI